MTVTPSDASVSKLSALAEYRDLLSVSDLATIFDVSKQTIYQEMKAGKFGTPIKIGRTYKVPKIFILNKFFYIY
jgi:predicted DNA-binding transcriptional regulator AlpA